MLKRNRVTAAVAVVALAAAGWFLTERLVMSSAYQPLLSREVTRAETLPAGFIVWSSNRGGSHDIYKMTLPDRQVTRLTD
ncbi:MAG TPA: hypothetical protein VK973_14685, partial [Arenicellales bacterium]|nr:hypothetical protein [Arenicellales bacterium]